MAHSNVTVSSREIRKYIFEYFEEYASAPVIEQIMQKFRLERAAALKSLNELESNRHIILVPGTQRILMAWPFSSVATPFKVKIGKEKKEHFANCAWDAIAFHVMLRRELLIESYCHHCAEQISIHLVDQKRISSRPTDEPLVYLALPAAKMVGEHSSDLLEQHGVLQLSSASRRLEEG